MSDFWEIDTDCFDDSDYGLPDNDASLTALAIFSERIFVGQAFCETLQEILIDETTISSNLSTKRITTTVHCTVYCPVM